MSGYASMDCGRWCRGGALMQLNSDEHGKVERLKDFPREILSERILDLED